MKTNIVLFGGNGYIATAMIKYWQSKDPQAQFYALCRSGNGPIKQENVHYISCNVTNMKEVDRSIPSSVSYIVDCVGVYTSDTKKLNEFNVLPAKMMLEVAKSKSVNAMGYIGGSMGSKPFKESKLEAEKILRSGRIPVVIISPTLVYGNRRHDMMSKMVPFLKIAGFFNAKLKPVNVNDLAKEMVDQLLKYQKER